LDLYFETTSSVACKTRKRLVICLLYCFRTLEVHSSTEDTYKIINFKKAAPEQAAIKVRQKPQNVSLLPNDWQHTPSHRTRIGAWI